MFVAVAIYEPIAFPGASGVKHESCSVRESSIVAISSFELSDVAGEGNPPISIVALSLDNGAIVQAPLEKNRHLLELAS